LATQYCTCRFNASLNFLTRWVNINYRKPTPALRQHLITKWEWATQPYLMKLKLKTPLSCTKGLLWPRCIGLSQWVRTLVLSLSPLSWAHTAGMELRSSTMLVSPLEGYEWSASKCSHFISCGQVFCTDFHKAEPTAGLYRPQLTRKIPLPHGTEPTISHFIYWTTAAPTV
jgi:hypothetical protein